MRRSVQWRRSSRLDPRVRLTLRLVEEHKASIQLSVTNTSGILGLSEAHLLRLFNRDVGKTFRRYLRDVRMTQAAELVKHNAQPIKQIASDCGYSDVCNFYRDFKKAHSTTPRDMRLRELAASAGLKPVGPIVETNNPTIARPQKKGSDRALLP